LGPLSDRPVARQYRRRWIAGWNDDDSPRLKWHVRLKVVWVWLFALIVIFAVDVGLVIDAALDLAP